MRSCQRRRSNGWCLGGASKLKNRESAPLSLSVRRPTLSLRRRDRTSWVIKASCIRNCNIRYCYVCNIDLFKRICTVATPVALHVPVGITCPSPSLFSFPLFSFFLPPPNIWSRNFHWSRIARRPALQRVHSRKLAMRQRARHTATDTTNPSSYF